MNMFSIVIPCLNEEFYLPNLLQDLVDQQLLPNEVIIADCGSKDKTVSVAQNFQHKLNLKIVHSIIKSPGAARNTGAQSSSGEYLIFVDADMRIKRDFLEKINKILIKNKVDFITPKYASDGKSIFDRLNVKGINLWMKYKMFFSHKLSAIGGIMCVSRLIHNKVDGFDQSYQSSEDLKYVKDLNRIKASFVYATDIIVTTSSRRFIGKSFIRNSINLLSDRRFFGQY